MISDASRCPQANAEIVTFPSRLWLQYLLEQFKIMEVGWQIAFVFCRSGMDIAAVSDDS
jgi:hypothetical protein